MTPDDIALMVWCDTPRLSPDGKYIAYVVRSVDAQANEYNSQLWLACVDQSSPPRPLTSGRNNEAQPCWSPDGSRIAFTAKLPSQEAGATPTPAIQMLPFAAPGETVVVASGDEAFDELSFSPDGRWLAYTSRCPHSDYDKKDPNDRAPHKIERLMFTLNGEGHVADRPLHIFAVPTNGSSNPIDLTPGKVEYSSPSWYPDNSHLAATAFEGAVDMTSDIRVISLDLGVPPRVISLSGDYGSPAVSPDGSQVAVRGVDDPIATGQNQSIGMLPGELPSSQGISSPSRPAWIAADVDRTWGAGMAGQGPAWSSTGVILCAVEDRGDVHLYATSPDGPSRVVVGGIRNITGWSESSGVVAFTATDPVEPSELWVLVDGEEIKLSDHSSSFTARTAPQPMEHFIAQSGDVEVDAWILTPPGFDPSQQYPMLLNIHGGPFTQYGTFHFDEAQLQAAAGFVVVMSNPRGASGREEGWGTSILGPKHTRPGTGWGTIDYDDVMAVTDAAVAQFPFIDAERLGVLGGSYGGYMTSWIVTHSNRFAAACSERAANNLLSLEYGSDLAGFFRTIIGPTATEDPQEYLRMSPVTYVADLNTPLLIIHSEQDLRCPVEQADQLFVACQQLGKPDVEYYRFPGENHELSRNGSPTHRRQRAEIILEFFTRHLAPNVNH